MKYKFPLATSSWNEDEYAAIARVVESDRFSMGQYVLEFEKQYAQFVGTEYCVMVNSGSSANLLMVAALFYSQNPFFKLKRGDEIIVPAVSWSTTYFPLYQYGLKLRFVDVDMQTLNYDLNQLEAALTESTRAIMVVNLLGNPNDFEYINRLICERDIVLIEDSCESMGAEFQDKKAGTFGVMATFSAFYSHHIFTMEGGIITTDDEELYHILLSLRAHGWTRNLPDKNYVCGKKDPDPFNESFRFVLPGYNVRPLEMSGAVGIEQLKKLPSIIKARQDNAALMISALADHPDVMLQTEIGHSSWFAFSLVIRPNSTLTRDKLLSRLNAKGFECRPIVSGNFAKNDVVEKYFDYEVFDTLENAQYIDQNGLMIGNHHYCIEDAAEALSSAI